MAPRVPSSPATPPKMALPVNLEEHVRKICQQAGKSVVLVVYKPISRDDIKSRMIAVRPATTKEELKKTEESIQEHLNTECYYTTGFVVGQDARCLQILTCSHAFEHCYDGQNPIDPLTVNSLFSISITCDHLELKYQQKKGQRTRQYFPAIVSHKDLLLLRVSKSMLLKNCRLTHPTLEIGQKFPDPLGTVVMVSWPLSRHRTVCRGEMSHQMRDFADITDETVAGYNLTGVEVNITSEDGSSGAPLLDMDSKYVGVLHGGRVECFTYYISLTQVREALIRWGVLKS